MQRESRPPSIDAPTPSSTRRNLSDSGFSTCPSSCAIGLGGLLGGLSGLDTPVYAPPRTVGDDVSPASLPITLCRGESRAGLS